MHKILGPEVRIMATKVVDIRAIVMVMVIIVGRPIIMPML